MAKRLASTARSLAAPRLTSEVAIPPWTRVLVAVAFVQIVLGIMGAIWGVDPPDLSNKPKIPDEFFLLSLFAFGAAGGFLTYGGDRDKRAVSLGVAFLVIATYYADWPLQRLVPATPAPWTEVVKLIHLMEPGAFLPAYLWLFVRHFPETPLPSRPRTVLNSAIRLALIVGAFLFIVNLLRVEGIEAPLLARLHDDVDGTFYTAIVMALSLAGFLFAGWRARLATGRENRRFRLFIAAIILGLAPLALQILIEEIFPAYHAFARTPAVDPILELVLLPLLLSVPFTTSYAVLVHHVLDVKLIARRALQYALARYSALLLAAVPMAALVSYLVIHRHQTLADLFSGARALLLVAAALAGTSALRNRQRLLDAIDRRFFREQYDARRLLTLLVEHLRSTRDLREMEDLITNGIDRALHVESIALLIDDPERGQLVDPDGRTRSLDGSSALAMMVGGHRDPLEVDLEAPRSALQRLLPEEDRHWLVDGRFRLLVPLIATDGSLIGVIAVGGKKSELPFLAEDRELLAAVASSASLALELRRAHGTRRAHRPTTAGETATAAGVVEAGGECGDCGRVQLESTGVCAECGGRVETAVVPYVLPGKFRFERRIGFGGMGVVYRATDLALGRPVAIKTLRRLSPEDAMRLRREARTAASVVHPNLASVYGVETWSGTPLLVMEFLDRGTLRDRLGAGPLGAGETVRLGVAMAAALDHLHGADILHRDVKPSNIGYAGNHTPKLMDFGIARLAFDRRAETGTASGETDEMAGSALPATSIWHEAPALVTGSGKMIGTLPYLSPETVQGMAASPGSDLWSLTIVLYECLTGHRVFPVGKVPETMQRIQRADVPDLATRLDDCPPPLARFFRQALHRDPARRPRTAAELGRRLEGLAAELGGAG